MKRLLKTIVLPALLLMNMAAFAQQTIKVAGKVADAKDGSGLAGVSIVVKGTNNGTSTDASGNFSLTVPANATLVFTSVGYTQKEVKVAGEQMNVSLSINTNNQLNEVVVIGYGTARKKDLTGAINTVTAKDFNKGVITSPEQLIAGKVAGVSVTPNDGAPGSGSSIRIRGGASLNASNDPLIVVDGMPLANSGTPGVANPLALINPNDIESFTVLKDASATAIYGSRASNGVIIITTKKGQSGVPKFSFSTQLSAGTLIKKFPVLSAGEFRNLVNTYGTSSQKALMGTASTDWQDEIYHTAITTDNNLSIAGGLKGLPYRFSIGYLNQNGILKTGNLQRVTGGLNLNPTLLNKHLKVDISLKGSLSKSRFANADAVGGATRFDPTQPVYSGSSRYGGYWERLDASNTITGLAALSPKNPLGLLMQKDDNGNANRFIGNVALDYKLHFIPDLHAIANVGGDFSKGYGDVTINDSAASSYKWFTANDGSRHGGQRTKYETNISNKYANFYLNYTKDFAQKHRIEVMAGTEYQGYLRTEYSFKAYAYDTAVTSTPQYLFDKPEYRILSYLGRINYNFNSALFITASIRRDGSSKFSPDNRWGTFPSAAIAWKLSELSGLKNSTVLSSLKLRVGYGVTGQQDGISNYDYISYYGLSDVKAEYQFGNNFYQMYRPGGYYANRKWEQTATTNLGLDYGFFGSRISGSIDLYYKETTDLLNQITQPAFTNFSNQIVANVGTMTNKGIEFVINAQPVVTKNFVWNVLFNATYNKNEITKLDINGDPNSFNQIAGFGGLGGIQANAVGQPRGSFYVFQQIYDPNTGRPIENLFEDRNRDGLINNSDLYIFKSLDPKMFFGFSTNASYKKWSASLNMRANVGNYVFNQAATDGAISKFLFSSYLSNQSADVLNTYFQGTGNFYQSSYYVQNASFLKMDNVNVGYDVGKIAGRLNLRLNAGVQNVFTVTKYKGIDPELGGGIDNNQYPRPRTYIIGAALDF